MPDLFTAYLAPEGFIDPLIEELALVGIAPVERYGRLILTQGPAQQVASAQNIWRAVERIPVTSTKQGAKAPAVIRHRASAASISAPVQAAGAGCCTRPAPMS